MQHRTDARYAQLLLAAAERIDFDLDFRRWSVVDPVSALRSAGLPPEAIELLQQEDPGEVELFGDEGRLLAARLHALAMRLLAGEAIVQRPA